MNPYDAAHSLAKEIRESKEMKELLEARKALKAEETATEMLIDFRKEQLRLQHQQVKGIEIPPESEDKLRKLYEVINMNITVKKYIDAEYRAAILIEDLQKIFVDATTDIIDKDLLVLPEEFARLEADEE